MLDCDGIGDDIGLIPNSRAGLQAGDIALNEKRMHIMPEAWLARTQADNAVTLRKRKTYPNPAPG